MHFDPIVSFLLLQLKFVQPAVWGIGCGDKQTLPVYWIVTYKSSFNVGYDEKIKY
jgi:hypothetical protein